MLWHRPNNPKLVDRAANSAGHAIDATRAGAHQALDSLSHGIDDLRERAAVLGRASDHVGQLAERSNQLMREGSRRLRDSAGRASDSTALYIREEPFKAIALAAISGAVIALVAGWLGSSSRAR